MQNFPLSSLSSLLILAIFFWTSLLVGRARSKYGVPAPAVSGSPEFERTFRVQMNTLEQMCLQLPILWLCAFWVGDLYAALGGLVWSVGRILYAIGYVADPKKREAGFIITFLPSAVMFIAVIVAVVRTQI